MQDLGLISGLGQSPGVGNGNPLQYSCLENSMDKGPMHPWGLKELDMTEQTAYMQSKIFGAHWDGPHNTSFYVGIIGNSVTQNSVTQNLCIRFTVTQLVTAIVKMIPISNLIAFSLCCKLWVVHIVVICACLPEL